MGDLLDPQVEIKKEEEISDEIYTQILSEISELLEKHGMDSQPSSGAEWIPKKLLRPKKKNDVIRPQEIE